MLPEESIEESTGDIPIASVDESAFSGPEEFDPPPHP
jgi:hypothetical protein